jgi:hypothetical protein
MASTYSSGADTQRTDLRRRKIAETSSTTTLSTKDLPEKSKQKVQTGQLLAKLAEY